MALVTQFNSALQAQRYFMDAGRVSGLGDLGDGDPLIWTPGAIKDLVNATDADMQTLRADVAGAAGQLDDKALEAALGLFSSWQQWKDGLGFTSYLWYGTVSRTREYQGKIADWRKILSNAGARITGPGPNLPKPGAAPDWLKWAVIGAGVLGGTYVAAQALGIARAAALPRVSNPFGRRRRRRHHRRRRR